MKIIDAMNGRQTYVPYMTAKKPKKVGGLSVCQFVHLLIYRFRILKVVFFNQRADPNIY